MNLDLNLLKLFLPAVLTSSELYAKCASLKTLTDQNLISMFENFVGIFFSIFFNWEKTNFVCQVLSLNYLLVYVVHSRYFRVYARSSLSILFNPLSVPLSSKIPSIKKRNRVCVHQTECCHFYLLTNLHGIYLFLQG